MLFIPSINRSVIIPHKMEDIETDSDSYGYQERGPHPGQTEMSKKLAMDDQIDSGLGSLGYFSGEPNLLSLNTIDEEVNSKTVQSEPPLMCSLESSLSKLNISSGCGSKSDRCDSGLEDEKQLKLTDSEARTEDFNWVSSYFSPEQVVDIFRGDEDGDK